MQVPTQWSRIAAFFLTLLIYLNLVGKTLIGSVVISRTTIIGFTISTTVGSFRIIIKKVHYGCGVLQKNGYGQLQVFIPISFVIVMGIGCILLNRHCLEKFTSTRHPRNLNFRSSIYFYYSNNYKLNSLSKFFTFVNLRNLSITKLTWNRRMKKNGIFFQSRVRRVFSVS